MAETAKNMMDLVLLSRHIKSAIPYLRPEQGSDKWTRYDPVLAEGITRGF